MFCSCYLINFVSCNLKLNISKDGVAFLYQKLYNLYMISIDTNIHYYFIIFSQKITSGSYFALRKVIYNIGIRATSQYIFPHYPVTCTSLCQLLFLVFATILTIRSPMFHTVLFWSVYLPHVNCLLYVVVQTVNRQENQLLWI